MNKYKRGMISPFNLFGLLFISRLIVAFSASTGFIVGEYSPDIMISALISVAITALISIPIFYSVYSEKNILSNNWVKALYGLYFIYIGAVNVSRFSYFASTTNEQQNGRVLLFAAMIIIACTYSGALGIEALSRFASFIFIIVTLGVLSIITLSTNEFSIINLFPFTKNSASEIMMNSMIFTADSSELILFAALAPKVNGKKAKPFYLGIILPVLVIILLVFFTIATLGDAANLSAYPIFAMSQISTFETFERLDSVYMAFWIFATFLKTAVYLYCASIMFSKGSLKGRCVFSGIIMLAASYLFLTNNLYVKLEKGAIIIPFIVFAFVIPILSLIFRKKSKGEMLIEKF